MISRDFEVLHNFRDQFVRVHSQLTDRTIEMDRPDLNPVAGIRTTPAAARETVPVSRAATKTTTGGRTGQGGGTGRG